MIVYLVIGKHEFNPSPDEYLGGPEPIDPIKLARNIVEKNKLPYFINGERGTLFIPKESIFVCTEKLHQLGEGTYDVIPVNIGSKFQLLYCHKPFGENFLAVYRFEEEKGQPDLVTDF